MGYTLILLETLCVVNPLGPFMEVVAFFKEDQWFSTPSEH